MLPTPPHDDAVSVSYRPENAYLKRTLTSLSQLTFKRTFLSLSDPANKLAGAPLHLVKLQRRASPSGSLGTRGEADLMVFRGVFPW